MTFFLFENLIFIKEAILLKDILILTFKNLYIKFVLRFKYKLHCFKTINFN